MVKAKALKTVYKVKHNLPLPYAFCLLLQFSSLSPCPCHLLRVLTSEDTLSYSRSQWICTCCSLFLEDHSAFFFMHMFVWSDLRALRSARLFFSLWFTGTSISGILYNAFIRQQIVIKCLHAPGHTVLLEQIKEEKSCFSLPFQFWELSLHYVTF